MGRVSNILRLLYFYLGIQLIVGILLFASNLSTFDIQEIDFKTGIFSFLANMLPIVFIVVRYKVTLMQDIKQDAQRLLPNLLKSISTGFLSVCVVLLMFKSFSHNLFLIVNKDVPFIALFFWFFLILALAFSEELFFRYVWMKVLGPSKVNGVISSFVFAAMHLANPGTSYIAILNIFLFGLIAWSIFLLFDSLLFVSLLHASWNFSCGFIFGTPISGVRTPDSVFQTRIEGANLLFGGKFGLEGAIITTFFLLAVLLFLYRAHYRRRFLKLR